MHHPICETCGTQFAARAEAPHACPVCEDDRQYVGWEGQRWTTHDALRQRFRLRVGEDAGLLAVAVEGAFAIPQRMLLLPTGAGNILWESLSLVTDEAVAALRERGGVERIVISHPHFYSSMVEWSEALGGVPILLHADDSAWVQRPAPCIEHWSGDRLPLGPGVMLVRSGGHFPGSTVLHWAGGPRGGGALFVGDSPHVASDRRSVSFLHSVPNAVPLTPREMRAMRERLAGLRYEDVYGYSWGRNIIGGAQEAVAASFERHLRIAAVV